MNTNTQEKPLWQDLAGLLLQVILIGTVVVVLCILILLVLATVLGLSIRI